MTDDLFSRALTNADSITAEELKLNSVEGSEVKSEISSVTEKVTNPTEQVGETKQDGEVLEVANEGPSVSGEELPQVEENANKADGSSSEYDSSSSESDGDEDDSSESDGEADEDEQIDGVAEEEDEEPNSNEPIRSKNEITDDKIIEVPEDYKVDEKTNITEIGIIKSVFESNVIVQGITSGEKRVLKDGSIFCLENREVVGTLSEVFGQLQHPFYRVGISPVNESKNEIIAKVKELIGSKIFIVVPDAHWIDTFELKRIKGTDASNGYDEELPEDEQEFSDDEKEAQFKKMKKSQKKKKNNNNKKDNNNNANNNKITKKRPQNSTNTYAKMKLPIGMTQQSHYRSRNNRATEESNNQNSQPTTFEQNKYQPQQTQYNAPQPQGYYSNYNSNNVSSYPQSSMQNNAMYPPPQFTNGYDVPGQPPFNYNGQPSGYNAGCNMQFNYPTQSYQQYPPQQNFQQPPVYNQNPNMYYQQPNPNQYQPPLPPQQHQQPQSNVPQQTLEQVHQLHQILLQQRNSDSNQPSSTSSQNTGSHDKPNNSNNDILY